MALDPRLLANGQEQPVTDISQPRLDHALIISLLITAANKHLDALGPRLGGLLQAALAGDDGADDDALDAPVAQGVDGGAGGGARRDDRVDDDGQLGRARRGRRVRRRRLVVRQVVVVLDRLQRRLLAVQAQVVHRDRVGQDGLQRLRHAQPRAQDRDERDAGGRDGVDGEGVADGVLVGACCGSAEALCERLNADDGGDLVDQGLDFARVCAGGAQLRELRADTRVRGDVDIGR